MLPSSAKQFKHKFSPKTMSIFYEARNHLCTPSKVERANSEHFLRNVEQLHWKQLWTDVLIPSPKSMIEHILRNKIMKSFNYFSHRLTGIALLLLISLKLTNGMLRITLQTKFSLVNFRKVECKPLIRRFVTLIGSSQRTAFLNFVAGYKVFPQAAVQCVDYFWGFLFLANFQTRSENL